MQANGIFHGLMKIYINTAMSYGFIRSVTYDYKRDAEYYNSETREYVIKEKLLVHKIAHVSGMACLAIVAWPGMLYDDLGRLECAIKGKNINEYTNR